MYKTPNKIKYVCMYVCKADFRVEKRDISLLLDVLRVPPVSVQCCNGTICDGVEGLCIGWLHVHMSKNC